MIKTFFNKRNKFKLRRQKCLSLKTFLKLNLDKETSSQNIKSQNSKQEKEIKSQNVCFMYVIACVHHIEGCEAVVSRGHWRHGCARRRINRDMQHLLYTTLLTQFCHRNHTLSTRRYDSNIMHTSKNSRSTRLSNQSIPNFGQIRIWKGRLPHNLAAQGQNRQQKWLNLR